MARSPVWVLVVPAVVLVACGRTDYAEGLEQPSTEGVPTVGPGSGENLAALLHYRMQKDNPETLFADPSCPDVPVAEPGATVTCEMTVGADHPQRQEFILRRGNDGLWHISSG